MKLKLTLATLTVMFFAVHSVNAQGIKKGQLIGIHFNLQDFDAPNGIKNPSTGIVYKSIRQMTKGFSISHWTGLTSKIDLASKLHVSMRDYASKYYDENLLVDHKISFELEPTLNIRPMTDKSLIAPFITAGLGAGLYDGKSFGAYVPAGLGLQLNLKSLTYVFVQANYRFALTQNPQKDNLFYSFGVAESFGKAKEEFVAPPPPPVVEAPKDTDGDGIADANDKCPAVAGVAALQGCPDKDGDGITDAEDKCVDVKGLAKYAGCPIPDTDKDGVNDEQDKCIDVAGVARYQGCPIPDADKDGVNDEEDKCINEAGPASNFGCPEIKQSVIDKINYAAKNIFFATGSSKLLAKSYTSLNEVAKIMNDDASLKLDIDGHTDNTGDAAKNQALSETRSNAVKAYLAGKGVDESRMTATGYGSDQPVADNKSAAGRAKNRRVELKAKNF